MTINTAVPFAYANTIGMSLFRLDRYCDISDSVMALNL